MVENTMISSEAWETAQKQAAYEQDMKMRMQATAKNQLIDKQKKLTQTENEFKDFMNDIGEMRRMNGRIVATKMVRNPMMELRMLDNNRERSILFLILFGAVMLLIAFGL
jgi:hypothetical protein